MRRKKTVTFDINFSEPERQQVNEAWAQTLANAPEQERHPSVFTDPRLIEQVKEKQRALDQRRERIHRQCQMLRKREQQRALDARSAALRAKFASDLKTLATKLKTTYRIN